MNDWPPGPPGSGMASWNQPDRNLILEILPSTPPTHHQRFRWVQANGWSPCSEQHVHLSPESALKCFQAVR